MTTTDPDAPADTRLIVWRTVPTRLHPDSSEWGAGLHDAAGGA
jgi:hypothetical protein